jgi:1-deoxy-D-xylulose-5-phosphate reductoisomerase
VSTASPVRNIALLGSTGALGREALALIAAHPERFRLVALAAHENAEELVRQCHTYRPRVAVLTDASAAREAEQSLPQGVRLLAGKAALTEAATLPEADTVLCAVTGIAALPAVVAALRAGRRVALASKEILVAAGDLICAMKTGELVPVDSEHVGVAQCLAGRKISEVSRVILTASGGPFRDWSRERIGRATCADAMRHPVWRMGVKTCVDSATLMNKALELIEAKHLFGLRPEQLSALIHPQAAVHALAELCDGTVMAQLSNPDMKLAVQYALGFPERLSSRPAGTLDLVKLGKLEFFAPDEARFPALALGREAMLRGGAAPAALNAADEAAVKLFAQGRISLPRIWELVETALERCGNYDDGTFESRLAADAEARRLVLERTK